MARLRARYDALLLTVLTVGLLTLVIAQGADLRRFSAALGVAVFGLIIWRLVSTWPQLTVLEHALAMLLAVSPLVAAAATYADVAAARIPDNPMLWLVLAHRGFCVVLVVFWTRWLGRRTSPFRSSTPRPRATPRRRYA